jgi:hypothetical protein
LTEQAVADGGGTRNFGPLLDGVRSAINTDVSICHLETPLAAPEGPFLGYPAFSVPPEVAKALADVGYDSCSTASNHTLDRGEEGIANTLGAMDAAGLEHTGSARTPEEAAKPLPHPWTTNQLDPQRVIDAARAARAADQGRGPHRRARNATPCSGPTGRCSVRVPQARASPVCTADAGEAVEPAPGRLLVGREFVEPVRLRRDRGHR